MSPRIHNAAFRALDLDWVYIALEVAPTGIPAAIDGVRVMGIAGLSVTMPHKSAVARCVDRLTEHAAALDAVNCVYREGDVLVGDNTDGAGFLHSLVVDAGFDPRGRRCVVLGAGGAARAVSVALAEAGADRIDVVNRNRERAEALVRLLGDSGRVADTETVRDADLVVNATSVGMAGDVESLPPGADLVHGAQVVVDLIYEPGETSFLRAARATGAIAVNGLGMLVGQAAVAFERWTGVPAPIEVMTGAALGTNG